MTLPPSAAALRFGRFELQPHERRLLVAGEPAALGARALDLLQALAERAGQLVSKQALMDLVWPDVVVEENNLAAQISALRKVLGGDVIATIPGRGYRFTAKLDDGAGGGARRWRAAATAPRGVARERDADPQPSLESRSGAAAMPTNLPGELTALLGRADDLAALGTLIEQHRLVSIVGAGGIGKTLLAQHLLDSRRGAYPHGVCWVELAQVSDPAALPGAIAAALGVHGGTGEPLAGLVAAVAPLSLLLALDNAEHLLADVARVCDALRDAAPGVRLVVTSQAPLRLAAERVYRIGPLAVPDRPLPAAQAMEFGAVALFTDRARGGRCALRTHRCQCAGGDRAVPRARRPGAGDRAGRGARADARRAAAGDFDAGPPEAAQLRAATAPRRRASRPCARRWNGATAFWTSASRRCSGAWR